MTFIEQQNHISYSLSLLCASHTGKAGFLEKFRSLARQFDGVEEVVMVAAGREDSAATRPGKVFTSTPIRVLGEVVGELQVFVRITCFKDSSPLPLTRFLARQLEAALRGSAIYLSNSALTRQLAKLEDEVQEHKLFERARGIIESQRLIPAGQGARLLKKVSRQSGKNLRELANGILAAAEKNPWQFRKEFYA